MAVEVVGVITSKEIKYNNERIYFKNTGTIPIYLKMQQYFTFHPDF
jgi:hypothetical protein